MTGPTITVKDVWRSALPDGTELVGGGAGLDRRVEWACALRTRPPAFEAVKGGEVAFIPVDRIRAVDERLDLVQVMSSFAEKGGAAVVAHGQVSRDSIELADRLVLPLLRLPPSSNVAEVHQACVRFILDARTHLHERAGELQTALMQLALAGAGPVGIVDHVAAVTSLPALWLDRDGAVRHVASDELNLAAGALAAEAPALRRWADSSVLPTADPPVREFRLSSAGLRMLASPISTRRGVGGFVALIGEDRRLDQLARLAVSRAASACAIELDRERAVSEMQERLEGEFLVSLLSGSYASEAAVVDRARRLGLDVAEQCVAAFVLRAPGVGTATWEAVLGSARAQFERRAMSVLLTAHEGALCGLAAVPADDGERVAQMHVEAVRRDLQPGRSAVVSAGIGRVVRGAAGVRGSYRDAERALALGQRVQGPGHTVRLEELGLHRLLSSITHVPELLDFYEQTVGRLSAYDARSGGELMATLDAFFACHGSPTDTAQRLGLHRNTVLYRLRRIEEVGHLDLDDAPTRLNLHLCLRIRDVLAEAGPLGRSAQGAEPGSRAGRRGGEPAAAVG